MKYLFLAAALFAITPALLAHAEAVRGIPRGEQHPAYIEKVYSSPVGEVEFTKSGQKIGQQHFSGFLRNAKGALSTFSEVRGADGCKDWFLSSKADELPRGCEFVFYDDQEGRFLSVRSEEMEETTLFQAARGMLRGAYVAL